MISKTYCSTIKTIIRSPLIWGSIALLLGNALYSSLAVSRGVVDLKTYELILDTDPRYTIDYEAYILRIFQVLYSRSLMSYSAPMFCVITS